MRRVAPLIVMLVIELAAVTGLHLLPPPEDSFAATLRLVALAGAWWLLLGTVLCVVAHTTGIRAALQASARVTPSALRRRIERALAASIVAGTLVVGASPALADPPIDPPVDPAIEVPVDVQGAPEGSPAPAPEPDLAPPLPVVETPVAPVIPDVPVVVRTGRAGDPEAGVEVSTGLPSADLPEPAAERPSESPRGTSRGGNAPRAHRDADSSVESTSPPNVPTTEAAVSTPAQTGSYVVVHGDNLWDIAADHLAAGTGRTRGQLTNAEVVGYWVRLCDLNRPRLRSGDPSLIYAGETIELPPLS
jgi:nucleoid-associated protein YgaU